MLKQGMYVAENDDNWISSYRIKMEVRETEKSYIFRLVEFESRYSGYHIQRMFVGKEKISIKKERSNHPVRDWGDNTFTIYPFQAGIPFYFRRTEAEEAK